MKSIRDHFMFILPLLAVLIGIEFVLIFNRITQSYEQKLKNDYAILVSSKKELTTPFLRSIDSKIDSVTKINSGRIASEVIKGIEKDNIDTILKNMPQFYRVHLTDYVKLDKLKEVKKELMSISGVLSVETFYQSYESRYSLFSLIKNSLNIFITILFVVSLLLIVKQMEVWQLGHKSRMRIMEIFGAPLMLRSGVLFKMAFFDAIIATILNLLIFLYIKTNGDGIDSIKFLKDNSGLLLHLSDIFIWIITSLVIVFISVMFVAFKTSEDNNDF